MYRTASERFVSPRSPLRSSIMETESQQFAGQLQAEGVEDPHFDEVVATEPDTESKPGLLPFPVVGIGASAGGVEAYIELLVPLPPDTGMAFVLVPHLSADYESHLVEIIARHARMPVSEIRHHLKPQINHVYIIPRNARLL